MTTLTGTTNTLRERQKDSTRNEIVRVALQMLRLKGEISHESIAAVAGMAARTVYRHFPSREALIAATWEQVKADTDTRFPQMEEEILTLTPSMFRNFNKHERLVRAFLSSGVAVEVGDRGAQEGRRAFQGALHSATKHLPPKKRKQAIAAFLALYSASTWRLMRDRGELSPEEAAEGVTWILSMLLKSLKKEEK